MKTSEVITFTLGWITVSNSIPSYSGNYNCVPSYTTPDWVMVHMIAGRMVVSVPRLHHNLSFMRKHKAHYNCINILYNSFYIGGLLRVLS